MVIFSLKLLNNLRKAMAGRRFPHQLAGGVALGVLLGVIPHGNLLALLVLLAVLSFRVNHAMMGIVAIAVSFGATRLDTYSHSVGEILLTHPALNEFAQRAWTLPLMPWTDLNNTVVLGSFVIGVASVLPVFGLTLPIFRLIAPADTDEDPASAAAAPAETTDSLTSQRKDAAHESARRDPLPIPSRSSSKTQRAWEEEAHLPSSDSVPIAASESKHSVSLLVDPQQELMPPRFASEQSESSDDSPSAETTFASEPTIAADSLPTNEQMVSVETRIDVIRMKDFRADDPSSTLPDQSGAENKTEQPMDEALNYLLRKLRHSQQRKAAG